MISHNVSKYMALFPALFSLKRPIDNSSLFKMLLPEFLGLYTTDFESITHHAQITQ